MDDESKTENPNSPKLGETSNVAESSKARVADDELASDEEWVTDSDQEQVEGERETAPKVDESSAVVPTEPVQSVAPLSMLEQGDDESFPILPENYEGPTIKRKRQQLPTRRSRRNMSAEVQTAVFGSPMQHVELGDDESPEKSHNKKRKVSAKKQSPKSAGVSTPKSTSKSTPKSTPSKMPSEAEETEFAETLSSFKDKSEEREEICKDFNSSSQLLPMWSTMCPHLCPHHHHLHNPSLLMKMRTRLMKISSLELKKNLSLKRRNLVPEEPAPESSSRLRPRKTAPQSAGKEKVTSPLFDEPYEAKNSKFYTALAESNWKAYSSKDFVLERNGDVENFRSYGMMEMFAESKLDKAIDCFGPFSEFAVRNFMTNLEKSVKDESSARFHKVFAVGRVFDFSPVVIREFIGGGMGDLLAEELSSEDLDKAITLVVWWESEEVVFQDKSDQPHCSLQHHPQGDCC